MTASWTLCFVLLGAPMMLMRMLYLLALNPFCGFCDRAVARNRDINTQGQWARTNVDKWATWKWSISTIVVDLNLNPLRQVKTEGPARVGHWGGQHLDRVYPYLIIAEFVVYLVRHRTIPPKSCEWFSRKQGDRYELDLSRLSKWRDRRDRITSMCVTTPYG